MFFKTKKSRKIYDLIIAHRGYHEKFPENSIEAYNEALNKNYAIELDIRLTKDNKIICFHDRYTRRLLNIKGKTSNKTYEEIRKCVIRGSNSYVPLLKDVLKLINGKVALLIEVKGLLTNRFLKYLMEDLKNYDKDIYFHSKNIITYIKLKKIYKDKVFFILNPIRKRFNFIKRYNIKK